MTAALATVLTGALSPAAAVASTSAVGAAVSCASPPDTPDATTENRDRFVDLWIQRFRDTAWLNDFIEQRSVPDNIRAEGFHDLDGETQIWLNSCLLDRMLSVAGDSPTAQRRDALLTGLNLVIFGKDGIEKMREELAETTPDVPSPQQPVPPALTGGALEGMAEELASQPSLVSADHPDAGFVTPDRSKTDNLEGEASPELRQLISAPTLVPGETSAHAPLSSNATPKSLTPGPVLGIPVIPLLLKIVDSLLQIVAQIQGQLFTLPVISLLAPAFYKICAEAPTMPLKCSISLPVGIPIPADVNGDNFPDVLGRLTPMTTVRDVGARFSVTKLATTPLPLKAHVFAVYDTPIVKKRIQFGFDGRASSLAKHTGATMLLKNVLATLTTGDIEVAATVDSDTPGSTESLTFAVKDLVGGGTGVPAAEENPLAGAVQLSPFPTNFSVGAHFTHTNARSQDTFTVSSSTPSRVDAVVNQQTTTTPKKSNREFTATVDKLPSSVTVDLVREGEHQSIDYHASAPIDLVRATDTTTLDTDHPGSFTQSVYQVKGVPDAVSVDLLGAEDITYSASAKIPEVSFSTQTKVDNQLQQQITATAHQVPKSIHVTNLTTDEQTAVTYDADSELQDVELTMYDRAEDETNLKAKATGIPTHLGFTQTKEGVYDLTAPGGVDLIEATLTRGGGSFLDRPGDHATVVTVGEALGLDFQLTGFESAHFDGTEDTSVALGLNPGGQSFEAIADLDDPNVYARAFVSKLPTNMAVTLSPTAGSATYAASSVIPLLEASFTLRDTEQFAEVALTDLPKNIALGFNTTGATPQVTYDADSRLGSIKAIYQEAPDGMGIKATISDLPPHMTIGGQDPMVFDARTSAAAAPGSSYLGQIRFQYATDGAFPEVPTPADHAYVDTVGGTHAELVYSGLKLLSLDTSDEELHVDLRNTAPRLFRAFLTTPTLSLTSFIDKVPATIQLAQVGNKVSYEASSPITEIYTDLDRANGDSLAVDITGVPAKVDVVFDGLAAKLGWTASATTGGISALAHLTPDTLGGTRAFDAALVISSIPANWQAAWADGNVLWEASGSGIGSIAASVTNHGLVHQLPGDHVHAFFNQSAGDAPGDLDASLKVSNFRKVAFNKLTNANGGGFNAELRMGNQGDFNLGADITLTGGSKVKVLGGFQRLPSQVNIESNGGRITYTGNSNPDLTLSVEAGQSAAALAAAPTPPSVHGVSVRDGASGTDKAVKAKLFLTGLPTGLDLNSPAGIYQVTGYNPSIDTLSVNAVLNTLAPQPVNLQVVQDVRPNVDPPPTGPIDFKFGPFKTSTAGDGTHLLNLLYTSSQDLGALTANVTYGNTDQAQLAISGIPKSIAVDAAFGSATKTVGITMDHGISDITASYKRASAQNLAASVHLHDVPSAVNIKLGRDTATGGGKDITAPDFTMTASQPGLDIDAFASAEIAEPADIKAAANLKVTDLGQTVTGQLEGTSLHVTSTPQKTGSFLLEAAGSVGLGFNLDFSGAGFTNDGQLDVDIDIREITVGFKNTSDLILDLGITTGLRGDFSNFTFGLDTDTEIHIYDNLDFFIDWPDPFGSSTIDLFFIDRDIDFDNLVQGFHINSNTFGEIFDIPVFFFVLGECTVDFLMRPAPGGTTNGSTLSLTAPPDDGEHTPAWLITPDPQLFGISLPDFAMDLIAFFASPYGNGFKVTSGCHLYDLNPF